MARLNTKKYSRGGEQYTKFIVAISLITSCCYAGLVGTELKTLDDLHHFTLCLEFKSNVAYSLSESTCAGWIKGDTYKDSIYNVVSNAIADCVLERNEFAKGKVQDGVVMFDATPEEIEYSEANWNAVVLYNLVYFMREGHYGKMKREDLRDKFYKEYCAEGKKL